MAYDKVVDSAFLEAGLKKVGDSIRAKAGTSELLEFPDAMSAAVDAIDTSENLDDVLDEQDALIADIKSTLAEKGVKPEQTKTATPSLSQQTIVPDSGKTLSGVTVEPITSTLLTSLDSDFKAENIAEGVDMFGLIGTLAASAGMQVASGTVDAYLEFDADAYTLSYSFSVSGLEFKPQVVVLVSVDDLFNGYYSPGNEDNQDPYLDYALIADFKLNRLERVIVGFTNVSDLSNLFSLVRTNTAFLVSTDNGFSAEDIDVDEADILLPVFNSTYHWYAFG